MQIKQDIQIMPIFNQKASPKIWEDFTRLELLCDTVICGYKTDNTDVLRVMDSHLQEWDKERCNFAFAAYDEKIMVGFASGYMENKSEMYLRNLYVNPQYNGMGIGKRLLVQSERAANLIAPNMTVIALKNAVGFYEKNGYNGSDDRFFYKKLPYQMIGVVPVFKTIGALRATKLEVSYDKKLVNQCKNNPVFVYMSQEREIDAIGVKTPDKEIHIWTNEHKRGMSDFYRKQLLRALEKVK